MLERCKDCKDYGRVVVECCFLSQWFWNVLGMFWTLVGSPMKSDEVRSFR